MKVRAIHTAALILGACLSVVSCGQQASSEAANVAQEPRIPVGRFHLNARDMSSAALDTSFRNIGDKMAAQVERSERVARDDRNVMQWILRTNDGFVVSADNFLKSNRFDIFVYVDSEGATTSASSKSDFVARFEHELASEFGHDAIVPPGN